LDVAPLLSYDELKSSQNEGTSEGVCESFNFNVVKESVGYSIVRKMAGNFWVWMA